MDSLHIGDMNNLNTKGNGTGGPESISARSKQSAAKRKDRRGTLPFDTEALRAKVIAEYAAGEYRVTPEI